MKFRVFTFFCVVLLLSACNSYKHKDFQELPDQQWPKTKVISFEYTPEDVTTKHDLLLTLRYNTAITHQEFKFKVNTTSPSGEAFPSTLDIARKDAEGNLKGEEMGGYGDIEDVFLTDFPFAEGGTYSIEITHQMPSDVWGGILGVGIKIKDAE